MINGRVPEPATEEQWQSRQSWEYRVAEVCLRAGPNSRATNILLAVLGRSRPCRTFGHYGNILENGVIVSNWFDEDGICRGFVPVATVDKYTQVFSELGGLLRLSDADLIAMFKKARAWIHRDDRKTLEKQLHFVKSYK